MNKVKTIIKEEFDEEEFDERAVIMVLSYTLGRLGMYNASKITDDEIEAMSNPIMGIEFQRVAKCARRIGKECSFVNDVVPYIVENFQYLAEGECE